jgi:hypothetical protein
MRLEELQCESYQGKTAVPLLDAKSSDSRAQLVESLADLRRVIEQHQQTDAAAIFEDR